MTTANLPDIIPVTGLIDVAALPAPLTRLWRVLGMDSNLPIRWSEVEELAPIISRSIATARKHLDPANAAQRLKTVRVLEALPGRRDDDLGGAALLELYHMALDDIPADVLESAVRAAVRDTMPSKQRPNPTFRPSPNELRAYCLEELGERRRRLARLERIAADLAERDRAAGSLPEPAPTDEDLAAIKAEFGIGSTPVVPVTEASERAEPTKLGDAAMAILARGRRSFVSNAPMAEAAE